MAKQQSSQMNATDPAYIAVISMAIHEMTNEAHVKESGIITIQRKNTCWNSKLNSCK